MRKVRHALVLLFVCGFSTLVQASNITIFDKHEAAPDYMGVGAGREDDETEPGTVASQIWDLEGMFLDEGRYLSMIGGFNFRDGVTVNNHNYSSGDIFIDSTSDAVWGESSAAGKIMNSDLHWNYAVRLNFTDSTYTVWTLNDTTRFWLPTDIATSNPWKVRDGQGSVAATGTFVFQSGLTDAETGFSDWGMSGSNNHYSVGGIDLSFIGSGAGFLAHFVMECGNDPLVGSATVPEPSTFVLLGIGLFGLRVGTRRRQA